MGEREVRATYGYLNKWVGSGFGNQGGWHVEDSFSNFVIFLGKCFWPIGVDASDSLPHRKVHVLRHLWCLPIRDGGRGRYRTNLSRWNKGSIRVSQCYL